jgi:hypothetical protein
MALANYNDLKGTLLRWIARPDLNSDVEDFIALFEAEARTEMNVGEQQATATLTTVAANPLVTLPADFGTIISLSNLNGQPLRQTTRAFIDESGAAADLGEPRFYTQESATQLRLAPTPSGAFDIAVTYRRKFTNLSAGSPTNWLLTDFPNVYLYGSLRHAKRFMQDDQWAEVETAFNTAVASLRNYLANRRHSQLRTSWQA